MLSLKLNKTHYSEAEAAKALGVSVDQLHDLIRHHIVEREADLKNVPRASFHASDLVVLRFLSVSSDGPARHSVAAP